MFVDVLATAEKVSVTDSLITDNFKTRDDCVMNLSNHRQSLRLEAEAKAGGASAGLSFQIDCAGQDAEGEMFWGIWNNLWGDDTKI